MRTINIEIFVANVVSIFAAGIIYSIVFSDLFATFIIYNWN